MAESSKSQIPSWLHQIWMQGADAVPPKYAAGRATWKAHHPQWRIMTWDEHSIEQLLPRVAAAFDMEPAALLAWYRAVPRLIQRCDIARCFILYAYGGVYADMDTLALQPLDPLLEACATVARKAADAVGTFVYADGIPNNAVMAASVRNPLFPRVWWPAVVAALQHDVPLWQRFVRSVSVGFDVAASTGPYLWVQVLRTAAAAKDATTYGVARPPAHVFYPRLGNMGKLELTPEEAAVMAADGTYVYHASACSWLSRGSFDWLTWMVVSRAYERMATYTSLLAATTAALLLALALAPYMEWPTRATLATAAMLAAGGLAALSAVTATTPHYDT